MELIAFFTKYPETTGKPESLARELARDQQQIKRQMDELVNLEILRKEYEAGEDVYLYISPAWKNLSRKRARLSPERGADHLDRGRPGAGDAGRPENGHGEASGFQDGLLDADGIG
jgi:hypothetical protein